MRPKVLVTKRVYPEAIDCLRPHVEVEYNDSAMSYSSDELLEHLSDKNGAISQLTDKFSADVMDQCPNLKVIANVAVGFDNIDVQAATKRKIAVANTPDVLTNTTADFAFSLLMATARRIPEADRFLRKGQWKQWSIDLLCGQDIHKKTLGMLGMGRIGQAMAARGRGFEMRLLYHDAVRASVDVEADLGLQFVSLEQVLRESDFVSLHVPLLPETRKLIGTAELEMMKETAVLINTSRGPVIDEESLANALAKGIIAGAGLDVFEREPDVNPRLLDLDNAVLAPHIASASVNTRRRMSVMSAENVLSVFQGSRPPNLVNRELFG